MTSIRSLAFFNGAPCAVTGDWPDTATVTAQGQRPGSTRRAKGGDFQMATTGDFLLATNGDFFMATDRDSPGAVAASAAHRGPACARLVHGR
jgi:hypothetical protein